jgi:hypothetical protein
MYVDHVSNGIVVVYVWWDSEKEVTNTGIHYNLNVLYVAIV